MKKMATMTFIFLFALSFQSQEKASSCHKIGRSISSLSTSEEQNHQAEMICSQQEKIASLKDELDSIEKEKAKLLGVIEKVEASLKEREEETENREKKEKKTSTASVDYSQYQVLNQSMMMPFFTPSIQYAYSPFHNRSRQDNVEYLKLAMAQKLHFSMSDSEYWHPEWDMNGNMTNPIYSYGGNFNFIEDIYRNPLSHKYPTRRY